jgi:hypothetical protein
MRRTSLLIAIAAAALTAAPIAGLGQQMNPISDSDYMAKVATAAPAAVVKGATIVRMDTGGTMKVLQQGSNGFTCMLAGPDPMCADANAMKWAQAYLGHTTPPDTVGFVYMLAGDSGTSNTDPYGRVQTPDNHWVQTGPHVMIVGSVVKTMGYPMGADASASGPYVMWANTPYAHLMIPVNPQP